MLLGLGYRAGIGKDTVGDYLESRYGWAKHHFASDLKRACSTIFSVPMSYLVLDTLKNAPLPTPIVLTEFHFDSIIGWMSSRLSIIVKPSNTVRQGFLGRAIKTPRELLQYVGTDVMRAHVPDYHLLACFTGMDFSKDNVICDVRFPNEADAIVTHGGYCIKILRGTSLCDKRASHTSEVAMDCWAGWFCELDNHQDGLTTLYHNVDNLMEALHGRGR